MRAPLGDAAIAGCAPMEIVAPPHAICLVTGLAVHLATFYGASLGVAQAQTPAPQSAATAASNGHTATLGAY